jgi:hypothetical protein
MFNWKKDPLEELVEAIHHLSFVLAVGQGSSVTKQDLNNLEQNIMAKLSQIKQDVALVNTQLTEGLSEISTRLDELIAAAQDPDVTDAAFLADLEAVKVTADKLANIANPVVVPPTEPTV